MIKKFLTALTLTSALVVSPGCAFLQNVAKDPITQIDTVETGAKLALKDAEIAWLFVVPLLPVDKAAAETAKYYDACQKASDALAALDKLKSTTTQPLDLNTALKLEALAITGVVQIVHEAQALANKPKVTQGTAPMLVPGLEDADAEVLKLQAETK